MSYIGQGLPDNQFIGYETEAFSGSGSANQQLSLSKQPFSESSILVVINNVVQRPTTDYAVSGSTVTLVGTVASGDVIYVTHLGATSPIGEASALDLGGQSDKLVLDADGDTTISADTDDQIDFKAGGTDVMSMTATGLTINDGTTITTADNTDTLSLISTSPDANAAPILRLFRNSASPADDDVAGSIVFSGEDDGGNETDYASIKVITEDVTDGTEDGRLSFNIIDGGSAREVMSIFDNFVGIGTTAPEQLLHIHGADSGSSYSTDGADKVIIEHNDSLRIDMRTGTTNTVGIMFSDTTRNRASISYSHSTDHMTFIHEGDESFVMGGGRTQTGGETSGDVSAGGLCLDQNANDTEILTFKSSDVNAGAGVSGLESDTFAAYKKLSATEGGLLTRIQSEIGECHETRALIAEGTVNTTKSTSANAPIMFKSAENHSGGIRALSNAGTNSNLFIIADHTTRRFIFDSEGDLHSDSSNTTFDSYEDAHLVRAFDLSHGRGVIDSKFDEFVKYKHEDLADIGLVGREDDGTPNHFINITGFQRLHNGAIWQQYEKHQRLAEAVYEMAKEALGEDKADEILEKHDIKLLN